MVRIGVLTGGGDAPGLNAAIRAVVLAADAAAGTEVIGIRDGFDGLLRQDGSSPLAPQAVRGILPLGGTILGTANRGNPFARQVETDGQVAVRDVSDQVLRRIRSLDLASLIVIGGDGTLRIAAELWQKGCPIIGIPKTIDNDVAGTDVTFGFDTAVDTATNAIDRLKTTAEAHHRVMVLEVMGRDAGFIALHAGLAGGADIILMPERPFLSERVVQHIQQRRGSGHSSSIVVVAEGAYPMGGQQVFVAEGGGGGPSRLGGIAHQIGEQIQRECQVETRITVLGHLQRGGAPTSFDRWLATRYGGAAVRAALAGRNGLMVALSGRQILQVGLDQVSGVRKQVDMEGDAVRTARAIGIAFGD